MNLIVGRTEAYHQLSPKPPPLSLIGITPLLSIALQVLLVAFTQFLAVFLIWHQKWYKEHHPTDIEDLASHDNYAIFSVSLFQYITLAAVFSKGAPYRKPLYTNRKKFFTLTIISNFSFIPLGLFLLSLIAFTLFSIYLVVFPTNWIADKMEVRHIR